MAMRHLMARTLALLSVGLCAPSAFAQVEDPAAVLRPANLSPPPAGGTVTDPVFGTTIRRLTNRGENGGLATAEYPQLQAVNADETRILLSTETDYRVIDIASGSVTHTGIFLSLPRWHPMDPNVLIGFTGRSGNNIQFQHVELMGGGMAMARDVVNISALGYRGLTQGSWEDASADGRYIAVHNQSGGGDQAAVIDTVMGQVAVHIDTGGVDWVAVTPSGRYMAVQHNNRGTGPTSGLVIYDVASGNRLGHATDHHEHGDLGIAADGTEVFGTVAWTDLCAEGEAPCFSVSPLPDTVESNRLQNRRVFTPPVGNYTSCRAHRRGGFCVSSDDYGNPGSGPFRGEVWLNRMSDGAVLRLTHHRSSSASYYTLVRPTVSPTGRYVLFSSDWARPNGADQTDLYMVDLSPILDQWLGAAPPPVDAGMGVDSGSLDAGPPRPDTGLVVRDSGVHQDATVGGPTGDAGTNAPPPSRRGTRGGCMCIEDPPASGPLWLMAAPLVWLMRRRRR